MHQKNIEILTIGTVVKLINNEKYFMIIGLGAFDSSDKNKFFDYAGCVYPEGIFDVEKNFLFNHKDIVEVIHFGYSNEEEKKFRKLLKEGFEKGIF